ncbi:putative NAD(+) synthase (glutamine-hydrolyzing) [Helianthus annuus]|nr:putative NAD(+) synthase (glutamine-hydrolyzing) [Helianthus annuus]
MGIEALKYISYPAQARPKLLADEIGSWYLHVSIDRVVYVFLSLFQTPTGKRTHFKVMAERTLKI